MQQSNKQDFVFFLILAIGGGTIFKAMYLREVFFYPWSEFFGLTNTQSGALMSWLGFVGIFAGAISGVIVDKFKSPKTILVFSYLSMGGLAIWQSFQPSYNTMYLIMGLMSFVGNGLFLVSMTKIARLLANDNQQGRYFGALESGRGLAGTLLTLCAVGLVSILDSDAMSIGFILRFDGAVYIALGVATLFLMPKKVDKIESAEPKKLTDLALLVKNYKLWMVAFSVSCVIFVYQGASYLVPYLTDAYGMSVDQAALVGMIRAYFLAFLISPFVGVIADKVGSSLKVMTSLFLLGCAVTTLFIVLPKEPQFLNILIVLVLVLGAFTFGLRGIMYAQISEIKIPKEYTGTAMGLIICVGFSPEAYIHLIFGYIMDNYADMAYTLIFTIMSLVLLLGSSVCWYLKTINK